MTAAGHSGECTVSIIVPVLNEIEALPALMAHLDSVDAYEFIFVDGGSTDGSQDWIRLHMKANMQLLESEAGRAKQMNCGAQSAKASKLLFLHADTRLPNVSFEDLALGIWGRFDVYFNDNDQPRVKLLDLVSYMINLRSRISGVATGDQAIFVDKALFCQVGGFDEIPLMEDVALSKKLRKLVWPQCQKNRVGTSCRRWRKHGVWTTILLMWKLRWLYFLGVPPHKLVQHYR